MQSQLLRPFERLVSGEALIVAIDCGTSSTKAVAVDGDGRIRARASAPLALQTPHSGWVEHTVDELLASVDQAVASLLDVVSVHDVLAVGLSNQRESLALWEKESGNAISPVVSWQDRRATPIVQSLTNAGYAETVRRISGLPLDPMFSAVKATWLLDTYDPDRKLATADELTLGTVDTLIARHLTETDITEPGNASRTSLLDIATAQWSPELLDIFGVPRACLPEIGTSARADLTITGGPLSGLPLSGIAGDSHAALFAHQGWVPGIAKATLGTGSSVMTIVDADVDHPGLCKTIGWQLPGDPPAVALEANILAAGATLAWLASIFGMSADELAELATESTDTAIVPAFNGLGAPWWDAQARAVIDELSLSTSRGDFARAALDSVAWQIADVVDAMTQSRMTLETLVLDGGMVQNESLVQTIANTTRTPLRVSSDPEASARGAADIAGIGANIHTLTDLQTRLPDYRSVSPDLDDAEYVERKSKWERSLKRARGVKGSP
jgi:glycerol kinase